MCNWTVGLSLTPRCDDWESGATVVYRCFVGKASNIPRKTDMEPQNANLEDSCHAQRLSCRDDQNLNITLFF